MLYVRGGNKEARYMQIKNLKFCHVICECEKRVH